MTDGSWCSRAAAYERARPGYPPEVAALIVDQSQIGAGSRVLDVAAGTGKLCRLLAPTGAQIVAVEPIAAMRAVLTQVLPGTTASGACAEALGVKGASCDVVTVAQAFHWFDAPAALVEMRRVLRPGGHLFLVWNVRDTGRAWVQEFSQLLVDCGVEPPVHRFIGLDVPGIVEAAGGFDSPRPWFYSWDCRFDACRVLNWVDSLGITGRLSDTARTTVRERVQELLRFHPDLVDRRTFGFPFTTEVWHCRAV